MSNSISVIIPNYNHAAFLRQRIESVLQQTIQPHEIIILDDCSTDDSVNIIQQYVLTNPQIQFIQNKINSGSPFAQWNKGVQIAKGDLIWIAESDDVAEVTFLEKLIYSFDKDEQLVLAYCQSKRIDAQGNITGSWKNHTDDLNFDFFKNDFIIDGYKYIDFFLIHRNTIPNASAVVFKKKIYEKVGYTSEPLEIMGDWLVWIKILTHGKISFIAAELNRFRNHSNSTIRKSEVATIKKNKYSEMYGFSMRKQLVNEIEKKTVILNSNLIKVNKHYVHLELLNKGFYFLKNGKFFLGWKHIIYSFQFGIIKLSKIKSGLFFSSKKNKI